MGGSSQRSSDGGKSKLAGGRKEKKRSNSNSSSSSSHGSHREKKKRDIGSSNRNPDSEQLSSQSPGTSLDPLDDGSEDSEAGSHVPHVDDKTRLAEQRESRRLKARYARNHPGVGYPDQYPNHAAMAIQTIDNAGIPGYNETLSTLPVYYNPVLNIEGVDNAEVDDYGNGYPQVDTDNNSYACGYSAHKSYWRS
ncbi:uncharacterized protein CTRU02_207034 [Colletotrichum truncatum]|uniref:Uncharacterized protein n=1 Tax=Colletotrichum truncatum TaxID=5467 RepID=A0ACC3YZB9_COLTU